MSGTTPFDAALRWYPARWRREHGEVLTGTLMDAADAEGRTAPTRAELRDARVHGLAAWADLVLPAVIRDRAAAIALGVGAGISLLYMTSQWWPIAAWADVPRPDGAIWQVVPVFALWVVAAVVAVVGLSWLARVLTVLTIPAALLSTQVDAVDFLQRPSGLSVVFLAALAAVAVFGDPVRGRAERRTLLVVAAVSAVGMTAFLLAFRPFGEYTLLMPRGALLDLIQHPASTLAVLVLVAVALIARRRVLAAALLVAGGPWLAAGLAAPMLIAVFQLGYVFAHPLWMLVPYLGAPIVLVVARLIGMPRRAVPSTVPPVA